jgi:hypothetical protein
LLIPETALWLRRRCHLVVLVRMAGMVTPVTVMHEDVHQGASQQEKVRQCSNNVSPVPVQQKIQADGANPAQHD